MSGLNGGPPIVLEEGNSIYEQIRRTIRHRYGRGQRFTVRMLREAPELSHILNLKKPLNKLASNGFVSSSRPRSNGNQWSSNGRLKYYALSEVALGGVTVRATGRRYRISFDSLWLQRLDEITEALGISPVVYLRELVEADIARRCE